MLHRDDANAGLFDGLPPTFQVWMSHGDRVESLPPGLPVWPIRKTPGAAIGNGDNMFGLQFHPEVNPHAAGPVDSGELPVPHLRVQAFLDTG